MATNMLGINVEPASEELENTFMQRFPPAYRPLNVQCPAQGRRPGYWTKCAAVSATASRASARLHQRLGAAPP
jgi:hypothetical protein